MVKSPLVLRNYAQKYRAIPRVWHTQIPTFLSDELEKVQRRALRILHPDKHYSEALILNDCPLLSDKRANLCTKTFSKICTPQSRLNHLVAKARLNAHSNFLRNNRSLTLPMCRTDRFKRSFLPAMCYK